MSSRFGRDGLPQLDYEIRNDDSILTIFGEYLVENHSGRLFEGIVPLISFHEFT